MYPSAVDRYRIIEKLIRAARERFADRGIDQESLARRARVAQTTISNLEHLEKSLAQPKRHVGRDELLKVITWGLQLGQEELDAILWLYDGEPLRSEEIRWFVKGYLPEASPGTCRPEAFRGVVLHWLRGMLDRNLAEGGPQPAKVRVFSNDENDRRQAEQLILDLDKMPGHRLVVYPIVVYPNSPHSSMFVPPPNMSAPGDRRAAEAAIALRSESYQYHSSLQLYGRRGIHSRKAIEAEMKRAGVDPAVRVELRRRLRRWIDFLKAYEHYELALAETTPELFVLIKSTQRAVIGPMENLGEDSHWGPRWIEWFDEPSVLRFLVDFETRWDTIPEEYRLKESVIQWLESRLAVIAD